MAAQWLAAPLHESGTKRLCLGALRIPLLISLVGRLVGSLAVAFGWRSSRGAFLKVASAVTGAREHDDFLSLQRRHRRMCQRVLLVSGHSSDLGTLAAREAALHSNAQKNKA